MIFSDFLPEKGGISSVTREQMGVKGRHHIVCVAQGDIVYGVYSGQGATRRPRDIVGGSKNGQL